MGGALVWLLLLLVPLWLFIRWLKPPPPIWTYHNIKQIVADNQLDLPAMFVDLDAFESNVKLLVEMARSSGKTVRIATKSIRCPALITRVCDLGQDVVKGFMCYSIHEANFLATNYDLDDFYIPYPTGQVSDTNVALDLSIDLGKKITLTVDCVDLVTRLNEYCSAYFLRNPLKSRKARASRLLPVAIDLDMSYKVFGYRLGAHRSNVDTIDKFSAIAGAIGNSQHLRLAGVLGYEGHVAGNPDTSPHSLFPNSIVRLLKKKYFYPHAVKFRRDIAQYCADNNIKLEFFNGGGSGNFGDVCRDPCVTEVTAGSGFLQSQLFDYYEMNKCEPAIYFALQATRIGNDFITCQSGGFVASGPCSQDKFPKPYANPLMLTHYDVEGYGEVQTPLKIQGSNPGVRGTISLGDPVLFRPAKAGEIAEHFNRYHLIRRDRYVETRNTYRGRGVIFY